MTTVNIYLSFNGECQQAFDFYKSVFGGEYTYCAKYKEMPAMEGCEPVLGADGEKLMHVSLPISKETVLMGADLVGPMATGLVKGNNFSIMAGADNKAEADRIFKALSNAGSVMMPMADQFWGDYFGILTDKFGIFWNICVEGKKA